MIKDIYVDKHLIDFIYKNKTISLEDIPKDFILDGEFLRLIDDSDLKTTALIYRVKDTIKLADTWKNKTLNGFSPKDLNQLVYFNQLVESQFILNAAIGAAGTGKTTIALAYALAEYLNKNKTIYLSKPTIMVQNNDAFGPVPGDINEKYAPYIGSFEIILNKALGDNSKHYLQQMLHNKHLQFFPVEFTRGCTFEDCTFILDEVQNLTWHELKTVLSRIGENSKIIICGDPHQIDANFTYKESGLHKLLNSDSFNNSNITSQITLTKQYRGKLPDLIYRIDKE